MAIDYIENNVKTKYTIKCTKNTLAKNFKMALKCAQAIICNLEIIKLMNPTNE